MNYRINGILIVLAFWLFICIGCAYIIFKNFKKDIPENKKFFRKYIKTAFSNGFVYSSIFSIVIACVLYGFLDKILTLINLPTGLINYCTFASKIWFISSPFIGLEIAILGYYIAINYYRKPLIIVFSKLILFLLISLFYYESKKFNCFLYAKPICDFIFLIYYSKICFDITLK